MPSVARMEFANANETAMEMGWFPILFLARAGAQDIETCFAWKPETKVASPRLANEASLWCA